MSEKFLKGVSEGPGLGGKKIKPDGLSEKTVPRALVGDFNRAVMMALALVAATDGYKVEAQEPEVSDPCGGMSEEEFVANHLPIKEDGVAKEENTVGRNWDGPKPLAFDDIGLFQQCAPSVVNDAFVADKLIPYLNPLDTSPPSWGFIPYSANPVGPQTKEALRKLMLEDEDLRRSIARSWPFSCNDQDMNWSDYSWEIEGHPVISEEDILAIAREYPQEFKNFNSIFTSPYKNEKCARNDAFVDKLKKVVQEELEK